MSLFRRYVGFCAITESTRSRITTASGPPSISSTRSESASRGHSTIQTDWGSEFSSQFTWHLRIVRLITSTSRPMHGPGQILRPLTIPNGRRTARRTTRVGARVQPATAALGLKVEHRPSSSSSCESVLSLSEELLNQYRPGRRGGRQHRHTAPRHINEEDR